MSMFHFGIIVHRGSNMEFTSDMFSRATPANYLPSETKKQETSPPASRGSAGHGVVGDVFDGEREGVDLVGLLVGDLELELLLDGHHHLDGVQAVQPQILLEVRLGSHLSRT